MPFTPSHIAAVLPFARTRLFPAALVAGSMVPDLFFYVPLGVPRDFTHSALGVLTVDLALGVLLFALWELVFRRPLVELAPSWLRERLAGVPWHGVRPPGMPWWRVAIVVVVSVLLGSLTHVVWDSFTHPHGVAVARLPWLQERIGPFFAYDWAQNLSTVVGGLIVAAWVYYWVRRTARVDSATSRLTPRSRVVAWLVILAGGLAVALVMWVRGLSLGDAPFDGLLVFNTVTRGLGAAGFVAALFSLAWWWGEPRSA